MAYPILSNGQNQAPAEQAHSDRSDLVSRIARVAKPFSNKSINCDMSLQSPDLDILHQKQIQTILLRDIPANERDTFMSLIHQVIPMHSINNKNYYGKKFILIALINSLLITPAEHRQEFIQDSNKLIENSNDEDIYKVVRRGNITTEKMEFSDKYNIITEISNINVNQRQSVVAHSISLLPPNASTLRKISVIKQVLTIPVHERTNVIQYMTQIIDVDRRQNLTSRNISDIYQILDTIPYAERDRITQTVRDNTTPQMTIDNIITLLRTEYQRLEFTQKTNYIVHFSNKSFGA